MCKRLWLMVCSVMLLPVANADNDWGVRVGFADDPDAVLGGVHFNLGTVAKNLQFRPNIELGVGDDFTSLFATGALHYMFQSKTPFRPYAGAGLALGIVNVDLPGGDDSEFETAIRAVGGLEWPLSDGDAFSLELNLGFGDVYDTQIVAGWSF